MSAQESNRTFRIGISVGAGTSRQQPSWVAFFDELGRAGFIEGQNLIVDWRLVGSRPEEIAAEIAAQVQPAPDALVTGPLVVEAVQAATRTIPILSVSDDMVASGLVPSLSRPGGNLSGISIMASELDGKRQEILMELVPASRHMAALADPDTKRPVEIETLRSDTAARGVELSIYRIRGAGEIAAAVDAAQAAGATALNVLAAPILFINRRIILARTEALRLPAIYQWPEMAEEGGFAAYGPRFAKVYRQLARQVIKVLRGAKPADLPVEQPTEFELVINLQTAKRLGISVPPSILARADEVIE
jgi:putative ABC transport system substrate-binding protein